MVEDMVKVETVESYPKITEVMVAIPALTQVRINPAVFKKGQIVTWSYLDGQEFIIKNNVEDIYTLILIGEGSIDYSHIKPGTSLCLIRHIKEL
jgi:hypothetical protein